MAATAYAAGARCTVNVHLTPSNTGARYGGVWLQGSANTPIAFGYLAGTGTGPQVSYQPYTQTVVGSGLNNPRGLAIDEAGNLYILDTNNNRVLKETYSGSIYSQGVLPTSSLRFPLTGAVGGTGNFYVADTYNSRILNEIWTGTGYLEKVVISTGLDYPSGVAVDSAGNVYIADRGDGGSDLGHVYKETLTGTNTYVQTTLPFVNLNTPQTVALDPAGNVYVANTGNNLVFKGLIAGASFTQSTITTSTLNHPKLSVDPWGNIYIADVNNNRVLKETVSGSSYTESSVGTGLYQPNSAIGDSIGNVYIADTGHNSVLKLDYADAPSLGFPATYEGNTSPSQTVTVTNIGNTVLDFNIPTTGMNPGLAANFSWNAAFTSACPSLSTGSSSVGTLAVGSSCFLPISFSPTSIGSISGALVLQDNALNVAGATQSIQLSGAALAPDTTHMTLTGTPNPVTALQPSSYTATVADTTNTGTVPTGSVIFTDTLNGTMTALNGGIAVSLAGGVANLSASLVGLGTHTIAATLTGTNVFASSSAQTSVVVIAATPTLTFATIAAQTYGSAPFAVSATSNSSGAITYAVVSGPAALSGAAVTITGAGTIVLQALQAASGNYTAGTQSASFTVNKATPPVSLSSSSILSTYSAGITFTVNLPTSATGIVTFLDGATSIGAGFISSGAATLTTTSLIGGFHSISAAYQGDSNYYVATSSAITQVVSRTSLSISIGSTVNPSIYGDAVLFTFTFAGTGSATPTGSATITEDGNPLTTVTLDGAGRATYSISTMSASSHTIESSYNGDSNYE